jgi:hypothetical protein
MAITTFDGIINARAGGAFWDWFDGMTANQTPIAGAWYNLTARIAQTARATLTYGAYANGSANQGAAMNAATTGAVPIPYSGASSRYLTAFGAMVPSISGFSALMLIDILWSGGPVTYASGSTVTPSSVVNYTRYNADAASRAGNMIMIDVGTLLGGTPGTLAVNYTAQDASTTRNTTAFTPTVAAGTANRVLQPGVTFGPPFVPLVSGDTGCYKINSVTFGTGTSPTGNIYLNIVRPLLVIPTLAANSWVERDITTTMDSMIELVKGTDSQHGCLAVLGLGNGTTGSGMNYQLRTVAG